MKLKRYHTLFSLCRSLEGEGGGVSLPLLLLGGGATDLLSHQQGVEGEWWSGWGSVWAYALTIYPRPRRFLEGKGYPVSRDWCLYPFSREGETCPFSSGLFWFPLGTSCTGYCLCCYCLQWLIVIQGLAFDILKSDIFGNKYPL